MPIGLLFWILMVIWLLFGLMWNWPGYNRFGAYAPIGNSLLLFILLLLLGWHEFGQPLR
jgi:hypothetical protein